MMAPFQAWIVLFLAAGTGAAALARGEAASPNLANGRKIFATCAACHDQEQPTHTGPDLRGVVGRKSGSVPGFRYSRAMKNARITWDEARLDAYLAEPQEAIPGNVMPFPGLPEATERRDLIAYLKTIPLPHGP